MTGTASGEFTLWSGTTFNFESILQVALNSKYNFIDHHFLNASLLRLMSSFFFYPRMMKTVHQTHRLSAAVIHHSPGLTELGK